MNWLSVKNLKNSVVNRIISCRHSWFHFEATINSLDTFNSTKEVVAISITIMARERREEKMTVLTAEREREGNWRENCDEIKSRAHYNDGRKSEHCHIIFCHRERVRASFLNAGCNLFHHHHVFRARDVTMMSDEMRSSVRNILIIMMGRKMNGFIEEFTAIIFLSIDRHEIPHISKS